MWKNNVMGGWHLQCGVEGRLLTVAVYCLFVGFWLWLWTSRWFHGLGIPPLGVTGASEVFVLLLLLPSFHCHLTQQSQYQSLALLLTKLSPELSVSTSWIWSSVLVAAFPQLMCQEQIIIRLRFRESSLVTPIFLTHAPLQVSFPAYDAVILIKYSLVSL